MLLLLMSPQLLKAAIPIPTVVRTARPETVVFDAEMDGIHVALEVTLAGKGFAAHWPGAWCALGNWVAEWDAGIGEVAWESWERLHAGGLSEIFKAGTPIHLVLDSISLVPNWQIRGLDVGISKRSIQVSILDTH